MLPQIIMIAWFTAALVLAATMHGKPRTGNYNAVISLVVLVLEFALLCWGGFFDAVK